MLSIASIARNASEVDIRLFAESSRVRSNHCVPAVKAGLRESVITYLAKAEIRSHLMGLRL